MAITERWHREGLVLYSPFYSCSLPASLPRRRFRAVCRAPACFRRLSCNRCSHAFRFSRTRNEKGTVFLSRFVPFGCKRRVSMTEHLLSNESDFCRFCNEAKRSPFFELSNILPQRPFFSCPPPRSRVHFHAPITINGMHRRCEINEGTTPFPLFSRH